MTSLVGIFPTASGDSLRITRESDTAAYVGIGVDDPKEKLHVKEAVLFENGIVASHRHTTNLSPGIVRRRYALPLAIGVDGIRDTHEMDTFVRTHVIDPAVSVDTTCAITGILTTRTYTEYVGDVLVTQADDYQFEAILPSTTAEESMVIDMFIDGKRVIANYYDVTAQKVLASRSNIYLTPGYHHMVARAYSGSVEPTMTLQWKRVDDALLTTISSTNTYYSPSELFIADETGLLVPYSASTVYTIKDSVGQNVVEVYDTYMQVTPTFRVKSANDVVHLEANTIRTYIKELEVGGNVRVQNDVIAFTTIATASDARLKSNIVHLSDPLAKIGNLHGYTFERIDVNNRVMAGVLAHEVESVLPSAVITDHGTGYNYVSYDQLSALYIESIKALLSRIQTLEEHVTTLRP